MSIEAFERRQEMLDLREKLLEAEQERILGSKTYTAQEVNQRLKRLIDEGVYSPLLSGRGIFLQV